MWCTKLHPGRRSRLSLIHQGQHPLKPCCFLQEAPRLVLLLVAAAAVLVAAAAFAFDTEGGHLPAHADPLAQVLCCCCGQQDVARCHDQSCAAHGGTAAAAAGRLLPALQVQTTPMHACGVTPAPCRHLQWSLRQVQHELGAGAGCAAWEGCAAPWHLFSQGCMPWHTDAAFAPVRMPHHMRWSLKLLLLPVRLPLPLLLLQIAS